MKAVEMNYNEIPKLDIINRTLEAVKSRGINTFTADNREKALDKLRELLPAGARIMTAASTTLTEILN